MIFHCWIGQFNTDQRKKLNFWLKFKFKSEKLWIISKTLINCRKMQIKAVFTCAMTILLKIYFISWMFDESCKLIQFIFNYWKAKNDSFEKYQKLLSITLHLNNSFLLHNASIIFNTDFIRRCTAAYEEIWINFISSHFSLNEIHYCINKSSGGQNVKRRASS